MHSSLAVLNCASQSAIRANLAVGSWITILWEIVIGWVWAVRIGRVRVVGIVGAWRVVIVIPIVTGWGIAIGRILLCWITVWTWRSGRLGGTNGHSNWNGHNTPHHYNKHNCSNVEAQRYVSLCPGSRNVTSFLIILRLMRKNWEMVFKVIKKSMQWVTHIIRYH